MAQQRSRNVPFDLNLGLTAKATQARNANVAFQQALADQSPGDNCGIKVSSRIVPLGAVYRSVLLPAGVPTVIIPEASTSHTYMVSNPGETNGFLATPTIFASAARTSGGSPFVSAAFNVSSTDRVGLFLDVTASSGGGYVTMVIDSQSKDPLSGNWATTHTDIFGGQIAVGTYYYLLTQNGDDQNFRLKATIALAGSITFSVAAVMKGLALATIGNVIYLGQSAGVNQLNSYPIPAGERESFCLADATPLYGFSPANDMVVHILQLD